MVCVRHQREASKQQNNINRQVYYEELHYKNKSEGGDCKKVKSELEIYIVVWQFKANTHTSTQKSIKNDTTTPDVDFWTCIKPVIWKYMSVKKYWIHCRKTKIFFQKKENWKKYILNSALLIPPFLNTPIFSGI